MLSIFNFLPWLGCVFVTISICLECLWKVPGRLDPDAFKKERVSQVALVFLHKSQLHFSLYFG